MSLHKSYSSFETESPHYKWEGETMEFIIKVKVDKV